MLLAGAGVCVWYFVFKDNDIPGPGSEIPMYSGMIKLQDKWGNELNNKSSDRYKEIADEVVEEVKDVLNYTSLPSCTLLEVTHMSEGSIRVYFNLELSKPETTSTVLKYLREGFVDFKKSGRSNLKIDDPYKDIILEVSTSATTMKTTRVTMMTTTAPSTTEEIGPTETTAEHLTTTNSSVGMSSLFSTLTWIHSTPVRTTPAPVACQYLEKKECREYGNVATGFPNIYGNPTQNQAYGQLLRFMDLAAKGCYKYTMEFACASLYPNCVHGQIIHPCRSFCQEFTTACSYPIACGAFPDDDHPDMCVLSPANEFGPKTTPSPDVNPCTDDYFRCGNNKCVLLSKRCDYKDDCEDFSDEINCETDIKSPLDCDFENGMCNYKHSETSHFTWAVHSGATTTPGTGPVYDHTRKTMTGKYLLAEASGRYWLDMAKVSSGLIVHNNSHCLRFYYHMYGLQVETLKVVLKMQNGSESVIWQRAKQHGNYWHYGDITLPIGKYYVEFQATRGKNHLGDIALDDLTVRSGECPERGCSDGEFMCANGNCLLREFVCNGRDDCGDFSDEQQNCTCSEEQWQCRMGLCIDAHHRCDYEYDCPDTSDELDCACLLGQFQCPDGGCILAEWICDREKDCSNGEDEDPALCPGCGADQYQCDDYGCVHNSSLCNGVPDCADSSDERIEHCVKQREDDYMVEVRKGGNYVPLCSANFPKQMGDVICQALGEDYMVKQSEMILQTSHSIYASWNPDAPVDGGLFQNLESVTSCADNKVLTIECAQSSCGKPAEDIPHGYIVGGNDAGEGRWPWQVAIILNGVFTCGGSVISPHHILTAAHCTGDDRISYPAHSFRIILGSNKRTSADEKRVYRNVKKISIPEEYERALYFWGSDIAILAMDEPVEFNSYIRPVCLPRPDEIFPISSLCYVSGWGYTNYENESLPEILQEGKMKLWPTDKCQKSYTYSKDSMVCAGYNSGFISNCPGDSGGPLVCKDYYGRWKQVGVFSFMSIGCNVPMKPPVFTKVTSFLTWINDNKECEFLCDNKRCLVDSKDVCNGINDCGDMSDETRLCEPSVACGFEDAFACGYTSVGSVLYPPWTRRRGAVAHNVGPVTDSNVGHPHGYYMYSGDKWSILLAPIYSETSPHCLKFHYHMRSTTAGTLKVFKKELSNDIRYAHEADISDRMTIFTEVGHLGDVWNFALVDLPSGHLLIGFEGLAHPQWPSPVIALDDVQLTGGSCSQHTCGDDEFMCVQNRLCIPIMHRCNLHVQCVDESDEAGCESPAPYTCDVENYAACGLDQTSTDDNLDWLIITAATNYFRGPSADHTHNTKNGYFLYFNTLYGYIGNRAKLNIPLKTSVNTGCFQFYVNMISNGSISVTYYSSSESWLLAWQESAVNTSGGWRHVQLRLPPGVRLIVVDGTMGADAATMATVSYIAIDDITVTDEPCDVPKCQPHEYECGSGECISRDYWCDGFLDCEDGSDEDNYAENKIVCPCAADMFRCGTGRCLAGVVRCDGEDNCGDYSDELGCRTCNPGEYACDDGTCKAPFTWCDGLVDCQDGSDEKPNCQCQPEQFSCDNKHCIMGTRYCDGIIDCLDASDEPFGCMCDDRWHFRCADTGLCIPKDLQCNRVDNCGDSSDELNCECADSEFKCASGRCLPAALYCNGAPDCTDADDEPPNCECDETQFRCASGGCIPLSNRCDAIVDCFDMSDETNGCECYDGEFRCDNELCLYNDYVCNGVNDCGDLSDEKDCTCRIDQWRCANGMCIAGRLRCDGQDDCGDESDEMDCGCREPGEIMCGDGKCVLSEWRCDGTMDCVNGTDEQDCTTCDPVTAFQCADYSCVSWSSRCDGVTQCADGSDEHNCVRLSTALATLGVVEVLRPGGERAAVCAEAWPQQWSSHVCQYLGHGPALNTSSVVVNASSYLAAVNGHNDTFNISQLSPITMCDAALKLSCRSKACGRQYVSVSPAGRPASFIVGGDVAEEAEWPWVVGLYYLGEFRCGGVLFDSQWVLSAAHCFYWKNGYRMTNLTHYFTIHAGTIKRGSADAIRHGVEFITLHPDYESVNGIKNNDLALVKLTEPIQEYNDFQRPLCLPETTSSILTNTSQCYVAGWGYTNIDNQQAASELRDAKMQLWGKSRCDTAWGKLMNTSNIICAGYESGYMSTCFGDSGSPLMCRDWTGRWSLEGVTSVGTASCGRKADSDTAALPNIYVSVTSYLDWIQKTVKDNK